MANELCMNCFSVKGPYEVCRYCGYVEGTPPEQPHYLRPGTVLKGHFIVGTAIGVGGFGITYKCYDATLGVIVAIKEFFPVGLVNRSPGEMKVGLLSGEKEKQYKNQIKRFLMEAQSIAQFGKANDIVNVFDYFEENNTAYIVMEYIDGVLLKDYLEKQGALSPDIAMTIIEPVVEALKKIHASGIIHRDISPDNIFICTDSSVKLLDFGAAKQTMDIYNQTVSIVLKHGYAPPEQYFSKGEFGPWTDIYALGATMYRMFTGLMPTESVERMANDNMPAPNVVNPEIPQYLSNVIKKAMAVKVENRYRSVEDLRKDLVPNAVSDNSRVIKKIVAICAPIVGVAAIAICVLLGVQTSKNSKHKKYEATSSNDTTITEQKVDVDDEEKTTAAGTEEKKKPAVSDITGNNLTDAKIGPAGLTMPCLL